MKKVYSLIILFIALVCWIEYQESTKPKIGLIVNGKKFTAQQLNQRALQWPDLSKSAVIEKVIDLEVVAYEANRLGQPTEDLLKFFQKLAPPLRWQAERRYIDELRRRSTIKRFEF